MRQIYSLVYRTRLVLNVDDAILKTIIEGGGNRYGQLLTRAREKKTMSKMTFDSHLKEFVENEYVTKVQKGKQHVEYFVNKDTNNWINLEIFENKFDEFSETVEEFLKEKEDLELPKDPEKVEKLLAFFDNVIQNCFRTQNIITVFLQTRKLDRIMQRKLNEKLRLKQKMINQMFKLMEKYNPIIRQNYEKFIYLKLLNMNNQNFIQYHTQKSKLLEDFFKSEPKEVNFEYK